MLMFMTRKLALRTFVTH